MAPPAASSSPGPPSRGAHPAAVRVLGLVGWAALLWLPRRACGDVVATENDPAKINNLCSDPAEPEMSSMSDCYCLPHLVTLEQLKNMLKIGMGFWDALHKDQPLITVSQGGAPAAPLERSEPAVIPEGDRKVTSAGPHVKFVPGDVIAFDSAGEESMSISKFAPGPLASGGFELEILSKVGEGGYGAVFEAKVVSQSGGAAAMGRVAVKQSEERNIDSLHREYSFMLDLASEDADLTVRPFVLDRKRGVMIMELGQGDLHDELAFQVKHGLIYSPLEIKSIMLRVLSGLSIMHARGYAHRDLKPDNFIKIPTHDARSVPVFGDFGLACVFSTGKVDAALERWTCRHVIGTPLYMPPEAGPLSSSAAAALSPPDWPARQDVWAAGVVFARLLSPYFVRLRFIRDKLQEAPGPALDEVETWLEQNKILVEGELIGLLRKMLAADPRRRPHASECVTMLKRLIPDGGSAPPAPPRAGPASAPTSTATSALQADGELRDASRKLLMRTEAQPTTSAKAAPGSPPSTAPRRALEAAPAAASSGARASGLGAVRRHAQAA